MFRKFIKNMGLTLAILVVVTSLALAGGSKKVTGKVASVDAKQGSITLMTLDGQSHALQAPKKLLADLKSGDNVEIVIEDQTVKTINKKP